MGKNYIRQTYFRNSENCEIEFIDNIAPTKCKLYEPRFNAIEFEVIDQEIKKNIEHGSCCRGQS